MSMLSSAKTQKNRNRIKMETSEKVVCVISEITAALLLLLALLPIMNLVSTAFSRGSAEVAGRIYLWPVGFQLEGVNMILTGTSFLNSMLNSVFVTVCGVAVSMIVSILFAYPMSKPQLKGRKFFTLLCIVCMVFSGGIIPTYMVVRSLGLINNYLAIILPSAMSVFNMLIIKNYFESLPEEVIESSEIDGAGDLKALISIVIPMSTPVLATICLLYAIHYWNDYFNVILYITKANMQTLQVFIRNLIADTATVTEQLERTPESAGLISSGVVVAGVTTLGVVPIVLIYPFVQRFMIKGITVGSVKG